MNTPDTRMGYVVLRHGGAPAGRAAAELRLDPARAQRLEQDFRNRARGSPDDPMKPRYANNGRHVSDVRAQGGFPVLPERHR